MNWKIVTAFAAGAMLASAIVYMAVKPAVAPKPIAVAAAAPQPVVSAPPAAPSPQPVAAQPAPPPEPVRQKPSPMPAPIRKAAALPDPVLAPRAPINKEEPYGDAKIAEPPPPLPAEPLPVPASPPPTPAPPPREEAATPAPELRVPHSVTLSAGTMLPVRISETITSRSHLPGDSFFATLDRPLVIDGFVIAERGARVEGRVMDAPSGQNKARFGIELVKLSTADGQQVRIQTDSFQKDGSHSGAKDVAAIGAGAAIGAAIGAAASGGKGAAIGAGIGGAASAAGVALARDRAIEIPVEARITFRVKESVIITERLE